MSKNHDEALEAMMDEGARRGICGAGWRDAWWWRDRARALLAYKVLGCYPESMRCDVPGGGAAWVAPHPAEVGRMMIFNVCSDAAAGELQTLTGPAAHAMRRAEPAAWVMWWEAVNILRKSARVAVAPLNAWVGCAEDGRALLGRAVVLTADGEPKRLQAGETVFLRPPAMRWFLWGGAARQRAAASLADEGRHEFQSYLVMRTTVLHRARKLISAGVVVQDAEWPVRMNWARGRKPKSEKCLSDLSELS